MQQHRAQPGSSSSTLVILTLKTLDINKKCTKAYNARAEAAGRGQCANLPRQDLAVPLFFNSVLSAVLKVLANPDARTVTVSRCQQSRPQRTAARDTQRYIQPSAEGHASMIACVNWCIVC